MPGVNNTKICCKEHEIKFFCFSIFNIMAENRIKRREKMKNWTVALLAVALVGAVVCISCGHCSVAKRIRETIRDCKMKGFICSM